MSRLRRWKKRKFSLLIPALTPWANLCRAYGAGRNANAPFSSQRLRAGLTYAAPPVLRVLYTTHPALTRWANLCRAYGAGRNANAPFSSQRLRAGLTYVAPTALEERQILPSPPSAYALG